GKDEGLIPVGLGARDTLRFEANLPLYGQELSEHISPVEAGLTFAVKVDKDIPFMGQEKLTEQITNGPKRQLVAIEMVDRGIPRNGYDVYNQNDDRIGFITSGTHSPTLQKNIGLALINNDDIDIGTELYVHVRKRKLKAVIVNTPFLQQNEKGEIVMKFRYLPMTDADQKEMLDTIGVDSTEELFSDIPKSVRYDGQLNLKQPASEAQLMKEL